MKKTEITSKPKLSLVICSRNRAKQLKKCIESINSNEMLEAKGELILVNNNSTDDTENIMQSLKEKIPFPMIIINEPNIGKSYGLNAGILKARGEIIIFTDDDCYLTKGYLLKANKIFETNEFDYCGGQIWLYDKNDAKVAYNYDDKKVIIPPYTFLSAGTIQGANMVFHRRVIDKIGLFDTALGPGTPLVSEDIDYAARATWAGFTGAHIPELIVYHHHGKKAGKDTEKVWEGYYCGRGAYYIKFILMGRFPYLKNWYLLSKDSKSTFKKEVKGALKYLAARINKFLTIKLR